PAHRHEVVLGGVDSDPVQPGVEGALAAEGRQGPIGLDEGLLRHVLYLCRIADEAREEASQLALVLRHQQLECVLVPSLGAFDQLLVDLTVAHAVVFGWASGATKNARTGSRDEAPV